jgi:cell division protein ZipA
MSTELRWILLGLGVLFCVGLWWWESRRGRQAADASADLRAADPFASLNALAREATGRDSLPREVPRRLEPDVAPAPAPTPLPVRDQLRVPEHDLADEKLRIQEEPDVPPRSRFAPGGASAEMDVATHPVVSEHGRIEPTVGALEPEPPPAPAEEFPSSLEEPVQEKIVTIRVASPPLERFEGSMLVRALGEAGLEHGRFSIFHRIGSHGETLFSVASLVEPGTFDLDAVEGKRYPGVSFFTVLRRPEDALEVFDEMLNTARELAHQVRGSLQDDRGANLGLQRLSVLRDDVVAWQKTALRSRST